jgi:hypothetical protein
MRVRLPGIYASLSRFTPFEGVWPETADVTVASNN